MLQTDSLRKAGDSRGSYITAPQTTQNWSSWAISTPESPLTGQLSSVASHSPTIWFLSLHHWPPLIHSSVSLTFIRRSHSDLPLSHHFSKSSFWGGGEASSFTPKQPSGEFPKQRIISPNMENATGLFWQTSCCRFSVLVFNGDFLSSCCICMCC